MVPTESVLLSREIQKPTSLLLSMGCGHRPTTARRPWLSAACPSRATTTPTSSPPKQCPTASMWGWRHLNTSPAASLSPKASRGFQKKIFGTSLTNPTLAAPACWTRPRLLRLRRASTPWRPNPSCSQRPPKELKKANRKLKKFTDSTCLHLRLLCGLSFSRDICPVGRLFAKLGESDDERA